MPSQLCCHHRHHDHSQFTLFYALKDYIQGIAQILYEETSPEKCKDLETIEATVRHQVNEYVSPQIGIFLSNKQLETVPEKSGH